MKLAIIFVIIALVSIALQPVVFAMNVDELLLDRLVEKGIVSTDEAAGIRADAAIKTQEENAQKSKFGIESASKISFSGYLQILYTLDETAGVADGLKIRRARLDFRGNPAKNIGWRLQLDAVQPLSSAVSSTTKVVTRPVIIDAYIDYGLPNNVNFKIGQFLIPFSRENLESNTKLETINRSQVVERLVPGRDIGAQGRDLGIQLNGEADFGLEDKVVEYAIGLFNGNGINLDDSNESKDIAGRILFFPISGLAFGASQYNGKYSSSEAVKTRTGVELTYVPGNFSLKSEYIMGIDGTTEKYGYYIQTGYKFTQALEAILKYDSYDPNKSVFGDKNDIATYGLNLFLNKWLKIQVNYETKTEEGAQIKNNTFLTQFQVQY